MTYIPKITIKTKRYCSISKKHRPQYMKVRRKVMRCKWTKEWPEEQALTSWENEPRPTLDITPDRWVYKKKLVKRSEVGTRERERGERHSDGDREKENWKGLLTGLKQWPLKKRKRNDSQAYRQQSLRTHVNSLLTSWFSHATTSTSTRLSECVCAGPPTYVNLFSISL